MALSEHEQRLLDEMERQLYQHEADVVSSSERGGQVSSRAVVLALLAVAVGIGVVVGGLALQQPLVGVAGFVLMLAGVAFAFSGRGAQGVSRGVGPGARRGPGPGGAQRGSRFMDRLEERWDRRRGG